jgi:16S rRNA processing protein RimM
MDLIAIAKVVKPRGLKGEVVAELLTDFPERFDGLKDVTAVRDTSEQFELKIEDHWFQRDRIVLKFVGIDTVDQAEPLRGIEICVPEEDAVELESGVYFDWQLAGCRVKTTDGREIGKVRELMRTGGTELLVVEGVREYLIPFAGSICVEVDVENKLIHIDPPEGLLEF